jgi:hypothetical protein
VTDKDTGRVVKHIEEWDTDVSEVVKRLAIPASKRPETWAEKVVLGASRGEILAIWQVSLVVLTALAVPVLVLSLVWRLTVHEGLPGPVFGTAESLAWVLMILSISTAGVLLVWETVNPDQ